MYIYIYIYIERYLGAMFIHIYIQPTYFYMHKSIHAIRNGF